MSLWRKADKPGQPMGRGSSSGSKPHIEQVSPRAAISGGEISIHGRGFTINGNTRPAVRFGEMAGSLLMSSPTRLVVRVPEGVISGELTVDTGSAVSEPVSVAIGATLAENLHPVASPAVDAAGNIYSTFSGPRGQKVPVSVYKIDRNLVSRPFLHDLMNPTGLAFDRDGLLYISSRAEGTVYQVTPDAHRRIYAEGMGVATGMAFDEEENLYVGDRNGTIFKIDRSRKIFVFATIEPSVAAFHLAFGPDRHLYLAGPTTSSFDHVLRISPNGEVSSFYRGLGRPQGLAFDREGSLYVAASLEGRRGVVCLTPDARPELAISGHGIVGVAFTPRRSVVLATSNSLIELNLGIEGKALP